jgi:DNA polymerase III alpha subunit (gram-positive type)
MNNLLKQKINQKFVVFDTETEGLSLTDSRPWQLSWIVCKGEEVLEEHDEFIFYDDLNVSEEAARITGFNKEKYISRAKPPIEVWRKFASYLYDDSNILVGQNVLGYDIYILNTMMRGISIQNDWSFVNRMLDTKALATALFKDIKPSGDLLSWQMKLMTHREKGLKTSQGFLLKQFGIDHDPSKLHDALYDIQMNYKIFRKLIMQVDV